MRRFVAFFVKKFKTREMKSNIRIAKRTKINESIIESNTQGLVERDESACKFVLAARKVIFRLRVDKIIKQMKNASILEHENLEKSKGIQVKDINVDSIKSLLAKIKPIPISKASTSTCINDNFEAEVVQKVKVKYCLLRCLSNQSKLQKFHLLSNKCMILNLSLTMSKQMQISAI